MVQGYKIAENGDGTWSIETSIFSILEYKDTEKILQHALTEIPDDAVILKGMKKMRVHGMKHLDIAYFVKKTRVYKLKNQYWIGKIDYVALTMICKMNQAVINHQKSGPDQVIYNE